MRMTLWVVWPIVLHSSVTIAALAEHLTTSLSTPTVTSRFPTGIDNSTEATLGYSVTAVHETSSFSTSFPSGSSSLVSDPASPITVFNPVPTLTGKALNSACPKRNGSIINGNNALDTQNYYLLECAVDHYGGDIRGVEGVQYARDLNGCLTLCNIEPDCVAISYRPGSDEDQNADSPCYLKNELKPGRADNRIVGAVRLSRDEALARSIVSVLLSNDVEPTTRIIGSKKLSTSRSTSTQFYPNTSTSSGVYGTSIEPPGTGTPVPPTSTIEVSKLTRLQVSSSVSTSTSVSFSSVLKLPILLASSTLVSNYSFSPGRLVSFPTTSSHIPGAFYTANPNVSISSGSLISPTSSKLRTTTHLPTTSSVVSVKLSSQEIQAPSGFSSSTSRFAALPTALFPNTTVSESAVPSLLVPTHTTWNMTLPTKSTSVDATTILTNSTIARPTTVTSKSGRVPPVVYTIYNTRPWLGYNSSSSTVLPTGVRTTFSNVQPTTVVLSGNTTTFGSSVSTLLIIIGSSPNSTAVSSGSTLLPASTSGPIILPTRSKASSIIETSAVSNSSVLNHTGTIPITNPVAIDTSLLTQTWTRTTKVAKGTVSVHRYYNSTRVSASFPVPEPTKVNGTLILLPPVLIPIPTAPAISSPSGQILTEVATVTLVRPNGGSWVPLVTFPLPSTSSSTTAASSQATSGTGTQASPSYFASKASSDYTLPGGVSKTAVTTLNSTLGPRPSHFTTKVPADFKIPESVSKTVVATLKSTLTVQPPPAVASQSSKGNHSTSRTGRNSTLSTGHHHTPTSSHFTVKLPANSDITKYVSKTIVTTLKSALTVSSGPNSSPTALTKTVLDTLIVQPSKTGSPGSPSHNKVAIPTLSPDVSETLVTTLTSKLTVSSFTTQRPSSKSANTSGIRLLASKSSKTISSQWSDTIEIYLPTPTSSKISVSSGWPYSTKIGEVEFHDSTIVSSHIPSSTAVSEIIAWSDSTQAAQETIKPVQKEQITVIKSTTIVSEAPPEIKTKEQTTTVHEHGPTVLVTQTPSCEDCKDEKTETVVVSHVDTLSAAKETATAPALGDKPHESPAPLLPSGKGADSIAGSPAAIPVPTTNGPSKESGSRSSSSVQISSASNTPGSPPAIPVPTTNGPSKENESPSPSSVEISVASSTPGSPPAVPVPTTNGPSKESASYSPGSVPTPAASSTTNGVEQASRPPTSIYPPISSPELSTPGTSITYTTFTSTATSYSAKNSTITSSASLSESTATSSPTTETTESTKTTSSARKSATHTRKLSAASAGTKTSSFIVALVAAVVASMLV